MATIGPGAREIRLRDDNGIYRVIYVTKFADRIFVLHCFQKKTQRTAKADIDLASRRYRELVEEYRMNEVFDSVWDAIEDDPAEAQNMKLRSAMMTALCDYIKSEGLTQKQAAKRLGVTQPRVSDLVRGRIDLFAIDSLVNMLALAGLRIEMHIGKAA
jgi:predicted XRE-type DNA-binding protein